MGNRKPVLKRFKEPTFMNYIKRFVAYKLIHDGYVVKATYGYKTKLKRQELCLDKTHHNDAFVIAGGLAQIRCKPTFVTQRRRNNRSLSKFYDAKYIDIRDGSTKSGKELSSGRVTRNLESDKNGPNLRRFRGPKVKKGQVRTRKCRYTFQAGTVVRLDDLGRNKHELNLAAKIKVCNRKTFVVVTLVVLILYWKVLVVHQTLNI